MLSIRKYAAIDIGSNAIRLLIANVLEQPERETLFRKSSLVRVPIRLGADVFQTGAISQHNLNRMIDTMQAFKLLMNAHGVERYRACATSAMREASNGAAFAKAIQEQTGVSIDIIDGNDEASIISNTDLEVLIQNEKTYLYVDVGGGSTEFTLYSEGQVVTSRSFKIGTVRLLKDLVDHEDWKALEDWIKAETRNYEKIELIGSGGNINKLFKLSGTKIGKPLTYFYLASYYEHLQTFTYEERITQLEMNSDRADVIIPATRIYLSAMKWSKAKRIHVPKIGLADGIIKSLYQQYDLNSSR
ncbi:Ppx/GppA phosphatase family protein [Croceiramulus getboli]|nr:exopolyphosphatase [Flavobacteriaceae bacterium YJPT1-3]